MGDSAAQVTSNVTVLASNSLGFAGPGTILRCRSYIQAWFDATVQVGDGILLTFGLGLVSSDAAAAGSGSVPEPRNDLFPWLWWGEMSLASESTLVSGEGTPWGMSAQRIDVDTKAMRRVKAGESLVWIMNSTTASGAPVTNISFGTTRVLVATS